MARSLALMREMEENRPHPSQSARGNMLSSEASSNKRGGFGNRCALRTVATIDTMSRVALRTPSYLFRTSELGEAVILRIGQFSVGMVTRSVSEERQSSPHDLAHASGFQKNTASEITPAMFPLRALREHADYPARSLLLRRRRSPSRWPATKTAGAIGFRNPRRGIQAARDSARPIPIVRCG